MLLHQGGELVVRDHAGALGVDGHIHRTGHADRVGDLDLALARQAGGDDVLGHVAGGVSGRAVDLGWVLAREGTAAVRAGAAVGVDDDLAAGQAAIALRAADDEAAGRIDQVLGVLQPFLGQHRLDDLLDHRLDERGLHLAAVAHFGAVLAGQHDGVDAVWLAVHITHGHLALGVGAEEGQAAVLAQLGLALDQAVGVIDRRGHQFGRLVAGVAEHQALVAGADVQVVVRGMVDALGNVVALLVVGHQHRATLVVDAVFGVVVADALDRVARHLDVIHMGVGGDLAGQHDQASIGQRFGGHAGAGVLREDSVENRVRDLIRDLVGMAFGDGFRSKEKIVRHFYTPVSFFIGVAVLSGDAANALAEFIDRPASCSVTRRCPIIEICCRCSESFPACPCAFCTPLVVWPAG
eukprot:Opistho-2@13734